MNDFIPTQAAQTVHGLPPAGDLTDASIDQHYKDTCAIRSQEIVLRDFGINVSQEQLISEASANGLYAPGVGTPADAMGKLLELHGIGVTRYDGGNVYNLVSELSAGKRIIVAVDSGELSSPGLSEQMEDSLLGERPDHALIVAGIDTSDPDNVKVILTDPGTGHVAKEYPLAQFEDAWNDSNRLMIVTNDPAPASAQGMANFDYDSGHLSVGDMPYEDWASQYAELMATANYSSFDANGDGIIDTVSVDIDGDGNTDATAMDWNGDGNADFFTADSTGNGIADTSVFKFDNGGTYIAQDIDGDGIVDHAAADWDGDGVIDSTIG